MEVLLLRTVNNSAVNQQVGAQAALEWKCLGKRCEAKVCVRIYRAGKEAVSKGAKPDCK